MSLLGPMGTLFCDELDQLIVQISWLCMKSDCLQSLKVALQAYALLILYDTEEEGPHWLENAVHVQSVEEVNRLAEIEDQSLQVCPTICGFVLQSWGQGLLRGIVNPLGLVTALLKKIIFPHAHDALERIRVVPYSEGTHTAEREFTKIALYRAGDLPCD